MRVTRSEVAAAAGVSPAVVSYVLNNGPRPVAACTRLRVEAAVHELGYRPNAIAASLRFGATRTIGYLTPNPRDPFLADLGESLERQFTARDYIVLTGNTYYDRSREERYIDAFVDRNVDGVVLASGVTADIIEGSSARPVVSMDPLAAGAHQIHVVTADAADASTAVEHLLLHHGHRLVGCIAAMPALSSESERLRGWRSALAARDAPSGDELIAYGEVTEKGGHAAGLQLLTQHGRPWAVHGKRPTAVFTANDAQAVGVISACWELGLSVPEDVAIVSIGGTQIAPFTVPPLTTVRQDVELLAQETVNRLLNQLHGTDVTSAPASLRGNLVVARTCGCRPVGTPLH